MKAERKEHKFVMVMKLLDGRYVITSANKPGRVYPFINSGYHLDLPGERIVQRIIGVKELNEERTVETVANRFIKGYGKEKVLVLDPERYRECEELKTERKKFTFKN